MSYFVYTRVSLPHDVCTRVANDVCILLLHLTVSVRCTYFADDVCVIHAFAYNAVEYLHRYNFDGLDVDWEFPADGGSPAGDKQRFTDLLKVTIACFSVSVCLCLSLSLCLCLSPYIYIP